MPHDGRLKRLVLTEKGKWAKKASWEAVQATEKQIVLGMSEEELNEFFRLLEKMRKNLE